MNNKSKNIQLQIISSIIFIFASFISLSITINENLDDKKKLYTEEKALNLSIKNRIIILISVFISLYVVYDNYKKTNSKREKYKTSLLLLTNIMTLISALIILYVSILNKKEKTLLASDTQNTLI